MRWWALILLGCSAKEQVPAPPITTQQAGCAEGEAPVDGCKPVGVVSEPTLSEPKFDDCGPAPWGSIKTTAATKYVDGKTDGDGSVDKPFRTIQQAIDAGAMHVAVAAGTYEESLDLKTPVTIDGRCASMVEIVRTTGGSTPPVIVARVDATVRGVAVRGVAGGIGAANGAKITLEGVHVHDTGSYGLSVLGGADSTTAGTVRKSSFERCLYAGLYTRGAPLTVEDSVVRESRVGDDGETGYGVFAIGDRTTKGQAKLSLTRTLVANNKQAGIVVQSSRATIASTIVSNTSESALAAVNGFGIYAVDDPMVAKPSELTLKDLVLSENQGAALNLASARTTAERIIVRRTRVGREKAGFGIAVWGGQLDLFDSLLERNVGGGVDVFGAIARIERTLIKDTQPMPDGEGGYAVASVIDDKGKPSTVTIIGSRVHGSSSAGVLAYASSVSIDRCEIDETHEKPNGKGHGDGVAMVTAAVGAALQRANASITASIVTKNARAGVVSWAADVLIGKSTLTCNGFDLETGGDVESKLSDGGDNVCGCGTTEKCRAQSHSLDPVVTAPTPI